ncbi:DUF4139 domain-containing protein [Aliiroseovarius sp. S253]|uniref:DUF4139 domain-containing protein n=1 Tax=Aliiroseovarius sp. S253 TaxID=3415133 RepID=UPI003C7BC03C
MAKGFATLGPAATTLRYLTDPKGIFMRYTLPLLLLTAGPAFADTFHTAPRAVSATLYPDVAEVTHHITLSLPAGTHEVLFPFSATSQNSAPRFRSLSDGVKITQIKFLREQLLDEGAYLNNDQQAALDAVDTAQDAVFTHNQSMKELGGRMRALEAQLAFLASLSAGGLTLEAKDIVGISASVLSETETAHAEIAKQTVLINEAKERKVELADALAAAQAKLARLLPPEVGEDLWSVRVEVAAPTEASLELLGYEHGSFWQPVYEIHHKSDQPEKISVHRKAVVVASDEVSWRGIDLTLSTTQPSGQTAPRPVWGLHASVHEREVPEAITMKRSAAPSFADSAIMEEEVVVVEEAAGFGANDSGFAVTYSYSEQLDIGPSDVLMLEFGQFDLPADTYIHASPRNDDTAYLVAKLTNDSGAPLLGGEASFYRDGILVAEGGVPAIAAGGETDLPLGPVEHIRLTYAEKDDQVGERGFIKSATSRTHEALVRVENLSSEAEDVRVFFPTTYSEQEELTVTVNASPAPSETDYEDQRGVSVWDLSVPAGGQSEISIETTLRWPEGKTLSWHP